MLRTGNAMFWPVCGLMVAYSCVVVAAAIAICRQSLELPRARSEWSGSARVVSLLLRDFEDNASDALWGVRRQGHLVRRRRGWSPSLWTSGIASTTCASRTGSGCTPSDASALVATWAMGPLVPRHEGANRRGRSRALVDAQRPAHPWRRAAHRGLARRDPT